MTRIRIHSEIEDIDIKNRSITIKPVPPEYINSFYAEEKYMKEINFDQLTIGDKVEFTPFNKKIAQNIKIFSTLTSGKVKSTIIQKRGDSIIIKRVDKNQEKDFFAKKEFMSNINFDELEEGQEVIFKPFKSGDSYIAQEIEVLPLKVSQIKEPVPLSELSKNFILSIRDKVNIVSNGHFFENYTFLILKLLGISNIYPIPQDRQDGKCDGIFKIDNLEVIYDCTLRDKLDWKDRKKTQISNYINQIRQTKTTEKYILDGKSVDKTISFNQNAEKQIWIITKGETGIYEDIDGAVVVKEICIYDLIQLVEERLLDIQFCQEKDMARKLKDLGS